MKASHQWLLYAQLLEDRAKRLRDLWGGASDHQLGAVAIALIGASSDATQVAAALQKAGE